MRYSPALLPEESDMAEAGSERSNDDRIRERAYQLWERDDDPKQHADEYWDTARRQIEAEGMDGASVEPPIEQSDKRQLESEDPQEVSSPRGEAAGKPRAKRSR
jgi:hypothetical protein